MTLVMNEEQRKLVEENHNLIYSFLLQMHLSFDEYYDICAIALCNSAISYSKEKSAFSTYCYKAMKNAIMLEQKKYTTTQKRINPTEVLSLDMEYSSGDKDDAMSLLDFVNSSECMEDAVIAQMMFLEFYESLNDRDKEIVSLLAEGYKSIEVAEIIGTSRATVARIYKLAKECFEK